MLFRALLACICFSFGTNGQSIKGSRSPLAPDVIVSQSQRFTVHDGETIFTPPAALPPGHVAVEPELLAVSAERVHRALAAEMAGLQPRGGPIRLVILHNAPPNAIIPVQATLFRDGWEYRIGFPAVVHEERLVKGLVSVILAEFANRHSPRAFELPAWVIEGMTRQIFYGVGPSLVVDRRATGWEIASRDLHGGTRALLRTNPPPSFTDLSSMAPPSESAPERPAYEAATHLLVYSLLRADKGPQRFAAFLRMLPTTWNWQTAFRQSFGFERMLDAEKWWALASLDYVTRDPAQAWTAEASLRRLDEMLLTPVEVRAETNALPSIQHITLRQALEMPDWPAQERAVSDKLAQLEYASIHLAGPARSLAQDYRKALQSYLEKRRQAAARPNLRVPKAVYEQNARDQALRKLAELDSKRTALGRPALTSAR